VFVPVRISGHEYVDGGLRSPVPVRFVRQMGADIVDCGRYQIRPKVTRLEGTLQILPQTLPSWQKYQPVPS
jgi:NTE family protein